LRAAKIAFSALAVLAGCDARPSFDIVIRGGTVVDGTGRPMFAADVGIRNDRILAVGNLRDAGAAEQIDATGLFVAPGFINLHSHDRLSAARTSVNLLSQGVTTIILNADGGGPLDLDAQLTEAEEAGLAVNVGPNIGFNRAWAEVNGPEDRRPSVAALAEMRALVERGLRAGAWGVSAGLDYKPAYYARTEEVITVLREVGPWRTVFTNHDRITPESGFSSMVGMRETVEIGEATGLTPVITHMKIQGREQGTSEAVLAMIDDAARRGVYTAADAYPYLAGQTSLAALIIPGWAQEGGWEAMMQRIADGRQRARIVEEADRAIEARFGGPEGVFLPETGEELTTVMAETGATSGGDAVVRVLTREESSPTSILRFGREDDLAAILSYPTTSIACDCDPSDGSAAHPRAYGTFPRVLGRYVRELGVLTWEEAVRKMTGLPAATIGLVDRGLLAPGMMADVVVFDPETVTDHATYTEPTLASEGILHVLVNGMWALRDGVGTDARGGRALRRSPHMPSRGLETGSPRRVTFTEEISERTTQYLLVLDVAQDAGTRSAEGALELLTQGRFTFAATALGELQVAPGWASLTGVGEVPSGGQRAFLLILDADDPQAPGEGTTILLEVEGEEPVRLRAPVRAVVGS
jgi:N-acyl-D-amino-acid deacylase